MASSDIAILVAGSGTAPVSYTVPNTQEIRPLSANATFDGTNASGAFVPTLEILTDAGYVIARVPTLTSVAAGSSAEVTFAPFLRGAQAASSGGGAAFSGGSPGTITKVGVATTAHSSTSGTTLTSTITMPTGIQAGDLLLVFAAGYDNVNSATMAALPTGWATLYNFGYPAFGNPGPPQKVPRAAFYKVALGTESGTGVGFTITTTSTSSLALALIAVAYRGTNATNTGAYIFQPYQIAAGTAWSAPAPAVQVIYPSSLILQIFYDVKRTTSVTPPADTTAVASLNQAENLPTLYVQSKTADTAPSDAWTGAFAAGAGFTSYIETCQLVINPAVSTS